MKFKKYIFKKVQSTNDVAIRLINLGKLNGAILTDNQSRGRGQRGNKWISRKNNLFMSIFFEINKKLSIKKITSLNILLLKEIISKKINSNITTKLPNDILIDKKKVCGILQEIYFKNSIKFLIVGIGINIINSPNVIKYQTTCLNNYSKKKINKIKLFKEIKLNYERNIKYFKN